MSTQNTKSELRQRVRAQLKHLNPERRIVASAGVRRLLESRDVWQRARSVLLYAPLSQEPDVWPLAHDALAAGKTVALPRFDPATRQYLAARVQNLAGDIVAGRFGVREPAAHCSDLALNQLDLALVPGVAFDQRGYRLGRGKGFFDRLLESVRGTTCGVAFDEQIVARIPVEPHDIRLDCILTPTRWIEP